MKKIKLKRKTKRLLVLGGCAALLLIVLVLIIRAVGGLLAGKADVSAGVEYIRQEESGDIASIEEKIRLLEEKDGEEDTRSIKEKFNRAVILGDSIAEGFVEYDVLNASSVVAEIGVHIYEMDDQIQKTKELSPRIVFLSLGMNDVIATNGDTEEFIEQYTDLVSKIKKEVPDAHIFVNGLFPAQEKAVEEEPALGKIEDYNSALKEMCDELKIGFIDCTDLVEEQYYEEDGIHFKAAFYPLWAEQMAEVATL